MRRDSLSALMPTAAGALTGAVGGARGSHHADPPADHRRDLVGDPLMLSRCRGEMLSDVMFPPKLPHPSVIAGSAPSTALPTHAWSGVDDDA
jgi:hypothetical protein